MYRRYFFLKQEVIAAVKVTRLGDFFDCAAGIPDHPQLAKAQRRLNDKRFAEVLSVFIGKPEGIRLPVAYHHRIGDADSGNNQFEMGD